MTAVGPFIGSGRRRRRLNPAPSLIPLSSRFVQLGDSLTASAANRSTRQELIRLLNGRLRPTVSCNQGVGGERMDQMLARIGVVTAQRPAVVLFQGGTNDFSANRTLLQMQTDHQAVVDALLASGVARVVCWTIPKSTSIVGAGETKRTDFNTWLAGRNNITLVNLDPVYDPATADSYDGIHPSQIGARKIAQAGADVISPLVTAGSILYADAADATARGNLEPNWDFAGTAGGTTGSTGTIPTGQIATGWTVDNDTSATVTCSKTTVLSGRDAQRIDVTGSVAAQSSLRLTNSVTMTPSLQPGEFLDVWMWVRISAASNTSLAPVGMRSLAFNGGSIAQWGTLGADASVGAWDQPIEGVIRCEAVGLTAVAATIGIDLVLQLNTGAPDIRIEAAAAGIVKAETVAYAIPAAMTVARTLPRVTGTATLGSTLTGDQQTWSGGAVIYSYQWQRGTTDIAGATARTYVVQAADQGSTLRCVITGTNSFGAASYTTANTAVVP